MKGDSAPRLSWQKGKVEKLIYGHDNLVRGADVRVYQDKLGETIVIRRPLQLLVPLKVTNIIHNYNEINEPANERSNLTFCAQIWRSAQFMIVSKLLCGSVNNSCLNNETFYNRVFLCSPSLLFCYTDKICHRSTRSCFSSTSEFSCQFRH